ncbi:MAG: PglZ domain-containing protein [Saprospiraceae bacterium]
MYSNDWLLNHANKLQDKINERETWTQDSRNSQNEIFQNHIKPFIDKSQRLFVVISDALRYENGWELCQQLQGEKRYEADIEYMITGLPSYTQLGMAALLPHKNLSIHPEDCNVEADGVSTARFTVERKYWRQNPIQGP